MAFDPLYAELRLHHPMLVNLLGIIRADGNAALQWAKTQQGYSGSIADFAVYLECADISQDTLTPVVALHATGAEPSRADDVLLNVPLDFNLMLMISGDEPNDVDKQLSVYVLAMSQLWYSCESSDLFSGYHASAKQIGGNRRAIVGIAYGEDDAPKVRKGKYFRTAILALRTDFMCA